MPRITVSLPDSDFGKITAAAKKKAVSLSEYFRTLIQIGLAVEETAAENTAGNTHAMDLAQQKVLWKNMLEWQLEARYLVRHLADTLTPANAEQRNQLLQEAKQKAESRVNEILRALSENAH